MLETILTTVLSSALFVTSSAFTPVNTAPDVVFTTALPEKNYVSYIVSETETLASISRKYYGTDEYWTNIWNDNEWITDPENVEKGKMLRIRAFVPSKVSELETALADRATALKEQEKQEYLKSVEYLMDTNEPIAMPTIAPVVAQAPVAASSTISDEAVTYLGNCEAGMDPTKNTGNGYYGAFQFSHGTWKNLNTGYDRADLAPIEVQKAAVKQLLQRSSIHSQFPACASKMRSAGLI